MMLVGDVTNRTAIIIDDLADSATTVTVSYPGWANFKVSCTFLFSAT